MATTARIEELRKKFDENPRRYFAPYANEFRKQGDLSQAIALCRTHLPNQPGHISGHIVLAQALYESRELGESRGVFEQALDLDPENLIALRYLGDIAREQGAPTTARAWYQRVLEADPRNDEIRELIRVVDDEAAAALAELSRQPTPVSNFAIDPVSPADQDESWNAHPAADALAWVDAAADAEQPFQQSERTPDPIEAVEVHQDLGDLEAVAEPEHSDWFAPAPSASVPSASAQDENVFPEFTVDLGAPVPQVEAAEATAPGPTHLELGADVADLAEYDTVDRGSAIFSSFADEFASQATGSVPAAPDLVANSLGSPQEASAEHEVAPEQAMEESLSVAGGLIGDEEIVLDPWQPTDSLASSRDEGDVQPAAAIAIEAYEPVESQFEPVSQVEAFEISADLELEEPAPTSPADVTNVIAEPFEVASSAIDAGVEAAFEPDLDLVMPDPADAAVQAAVEQWDPSVGRTPAFTASVAEEPPAPFVTETMAELYLQQGFDEEALAIYRQLLTQNPGDETLRRRVAALEDGARAPTITPLTIEAQEPAGPSVREFFRAIATRVAAASTPAPNAAPAVEGVVRVTPSLGGVAHVEEAMTEPDVPPTVGGGLAAMFPGLSVGDDELAAADSLAAAFHSTEAAPLSELSLDTLFGQVPPGRADAVTSVIRAEGPEPSPTLAPGADGEASADVEQFTAWLEGLKKK